MATPTYKARQIVIIIRHVVFDVVYSHRLLERTVTGRRLYRKVEGYRESFTKQGHFSPLSL